MADKVDLGVLVRGYTEAVDRFREARLSAEPADAFLPLFEALNWAAPIDKHLDFPDHPELRGLRFARNRVHHQWADALYVTSGVVLPTTLPLVFFEWRWRRDLPAGPRRPKRTCLLRALSRDARPHDPRRCREVLRGALGSRPAVVAERPPGCWRLLAGAAAALLPSDGVLEQRVVGGTRSGSFTSADVSAVAYCAPTGQGVSTASADRAKARVKAAVRAQRSKH